MGNPDEMDVCGQMRMMADGGMLQRLQVCKYGVHYMEDWDDCVGASNPGNK